MLLKVKQCNHFRCRSICYTNLEVTHVFSSKHKFNMSGALPDISLCTNVSITRLRLLSALPPVNWRKKSDYRGWEEETQIPSTIWQVSKFQQAHAWRLKIFRLVSLCFSKYNLAWRLLLWKSIKIKQTINKSKSWNMLGKCCLCFFCSVREDSECSGTMRM